MDRSAEWLLRLLRRRAECCREEHGRHQADGGGDDGSARYAVAADAEMGKFGTFFACSAYNKKDPDQLHVYQGEHRGQPT